MKYFMWFGLSLSILSLVATRSSHQVKSCPEGYEFSFNAKTGKFECNCLPYHLYWPSNGLCYRESTQGPCLPGFQLVWNPDLEQSECRCPALWNLATDGHCYEEYTQGPCETGQLFIQGQCACQRNMTMHFHIGSQKCYQLYTKGPCPIGKILKFDFRLNRPECVCLDGYVQWDDGNCYELNTHGPCQNKTCSEDHPVSCFVNSVATLKTDCMCLPRHSLVNNTKCYLPYNQGPCEYGQWFVYGENQTAQCLPKKDCQRFDNWYSWPEDGNCYRQYSQGPCQLGKLLYLDPQTGIVSCQCNETWTPYYYKMDQQCYEQDSVGPCGQGQYFAYNVTSQLATCTCFTNFVPHSEKQICIETFTQATCPLGQLATSDEQTGYFKCDCRPDFLNHYWKEDGKCYEHFTQGPCQESNVFRIDEKTNSPACLPPIGRRKRYV